MKYPPLYTSYFIFLSRAIFKCRYLSPYIRWKTINVATWPWMFENIRGQQSSTRFFFQLSLSLLITYGSSTQLPQQLKQLKLSQPARHVATILMWLIECLRADLKILGGPKKQGFYSITRELDCHWIQFEMIEIVCRWRFLLTNIMKITVVILSLDPVRAVYPAIVETVRDLFPHEKSLLDGRICIKL